MPVIKKFVSELAEDVLGKSILKSLGAFSIASRAALGLGAVILAPVLFPQLRPIAKGVVKGGLLVVDKVKEMTAETMEQWSDLTAEARMELSKPKVAAPKKKAAKRKAPKKAKATGGPISQD